MVGKSPLCEDVDATVLEIGIKTFVGLSVFHVKTVDVVIIQPERSVLPSGLDDAQRSVIDGLVQQPVADKVDQPVWRDAVPVFRKLLRECLDKGYDIIELCSSLGKQIKGRVKMLSQKQNELKQKGELAVTLW